MNSPYGVNPSREIRIRLAPSEKPFHFSPVDHGTGLKPLTVMEDEARVLR